MTTSAPSFRFLDLPREIRDQIYDYALCSLSHRNETYTIEQYYHRVHTTTPLTRRQFLGTINLLLANRQIYHEACTYMLKSHLFVRVECHGVNIRKFMHGHVPPIYVLACDTKVDGDRLKRANRFPWYSMAVWIGVVSKASGRKKLGKKEYWDIVLLWEDLGELCKRLEMERAVRMQSDPEIRDVVRMVVEVDPYKEKETVMMGSLSDEMRVRLLRPVREGIRGFHNLTIKGCNDEQLVQKIIQEVGRPVWMSAEALLDELKKEEDASLEALLEGDYVQCVRFCAAGISTIIRLFAVPSPLKHFWYANLSSFENSLAVHYFNLNLYMARCLHIHISAPTNRRAYASDYVHASSTSCAIIQTVQYIFNDIASSPTMRHPSKEIAEVHFLMALAIRLRNDYHRDHDFARRNVLRCIKEATELCPENLEYIEEKKRVEEWVLLLDRYVEYKADRPVAEIMTMWEWIRRPENNSESL